MTLAINDVFDHITRLLKTKSDQFGNGDAFMQIREKIVLREKESADVRKDKFRATLLWKAPVDLDLYAMYIDANGREGSVYYGNRTRCSPVLYPFITLDKDAGIGDVGGSNVENLIIHNPAAHRHILIVANIFNKDGATFASYDGRVEVTYDDGESFEVPLSSREPGNWCIIASFDNNKSTTLKNINMTVSKCPTVKEFLAGDVKPAQGFLSKLSSFFKG